MHATRIRLRLFLALGLGLALATGCGATARVRVEAPGDVSQHRSWGWLTRQRCEVEAPEHSAPGLHPALVQQIEEALAARGYRHAANEPDVLVIARLGVRSEWIETVRSNGIYELSSHHSSPSYRVQGSVVEQSMYESAVLSAVILERRSGEILWKGHINIRREGEFAPHLGETVARLLRRLPAARSAEAPAAGAIVSGPAPATPDPS